jgi:hypothetical protein
MYSYFNRKKSSINLMLFMHKIRLTVNKIDFLKLMISFSLILFLSALSMPSDQKSIYVFGHSLFGNNNNGSGIQIQTNGNYKVELATNPSKIPLNKSVDILLNFSSLSNGGPQIMELPVYLSLAKDGKLNNLQHTPIIISGGHYHFKSVFPTAGKYLLLVDIKDIYYTNSVLNFIFELNADVPFIDQFYNALINFFIAYYYIYIPIIGLAIIITIIRSHKKNKISGTMTVAARWLYNKLHR